MEPTPGIDHIEIRPDKCGGKPCIRGTRIRVQDIYVWNELGGYSPDQIADEFPELSLADVHAALTYFWDHQNDIRQQIREDAEFVAKFRAGRGLGLLDRLTRTEGPRDSVSS